MKTKSPDLTNITLGKILTEDWIKPNGLTYYAVSQRAGIPASRLTEIAKGRRSITADTALRLGRFFSTGGRFWLNLQQAYHIERAKAGLGRRLMREVKPLAAV